MSAGLTLLSLGTWGTSLLSAGRMFNTQLLLVVLTFAIQIPVTWCLVARYGVPGAAWSDFARYVVLMVLVNSYAACALGKFRARRHGGGCSFFSGNETDGSRGEARDADGSLAAARHCATGLRALLQPLRLPRLPDSEVSRSGAAAACRWCSIRGHWGAIRCCAARRRPIAPVLFHTVIEAYQMPPEGIAAPMDRRSGRQRGLYGGVSGIPFSGRPGSAAWKWIPPTPRCAAEHCDATAVG